MKVSLQGAVGKAASPDGWDVSVWSSAAFPRLGKKQRTLQICRSPGGPQPFSAGGYLAGGVSSSASPHAVPGRGKVWRGEVFLQAAPVLASLPAVTETGNRDWGQGALWHCHCPGDSRISSPPGAPPEPPCKREVAGQWWPSSWLSLSPEPQGLLLGPAPCSFLGSSSSQGGGGGRFCPLVEELEGSSPGWPGSGGW